MSRYLFSLLFILFISSQTHAGDHRFETTAEGIVDALTRPAAEEPARTRSLKRSLSQGTRAIKVVKKEQGKTVEETVMVNDTPAPQSANLKIEFDTNSYAIRPSSYVLLKQLGIALTSERIKGKKIILKGHTDSDGSDVYNLILSLNRALSVQNYLVGNFNIEPVRIQVFGYGESMPLVPNISPDKKQMNRRVEVQALP